MTLAETTADVAGALDDGDLLPLALLTAARLTAEGVDAPSRGMAAALLGSPHHLGAPDDPDSDGLRAVATWLRGLADQLEATAEAI